MESERKVTKNRPKLINGAAWNGNDKLFDIRADGCFCVCEIHDVEFGG